MTHADRAREIVLWTRQDRFRSAVDLEKAVAAAMADVEQEAMEKACRAVCEGCAEGMETVEKVGLLVHVDESEERDWICGASRIKRAFAADEREAPK